MGWLQINRQQPAPQILHKDSSSSHIRNIDGIHTNTSKSHPYPPQPLHIPDRQLPFISPTTIATITSTHQALWLIIDNIVFDCTDFISQHPGGVTVINSFVGKDCSWQFWRFHGEEQLEVFGKGLRVGRTEGVRNPFEERKRWVGLRRLGDDEGWE